MHLFANVVNTLPLDLQIEAFPYDINGRAISSDKIKVEVDGGIVAAGAQASDSKLLVKLLTFEKSLMNLDRIDLKVAAKSVSGTSSSFDESQYLFFKDMKIKIIGGITIDANK